MKELIEKLYQINEIITEVRQQLLNKYYGNEEA